MLAVGGAMQDVGWKDKIAAVILFTLFILVVIIPIFNKAFGQGIDHTRLTMNYTVRDWMNETQTAYLPDTVLNRALNFAQYETMLAMMGKTNVDSQVIITTQNAVRYALNSNAIRGDIVSATRRVETNQGGGEVGLIRVDPSQLGKLGDGVIPSAYYIMGEFFCLATNPTGSDTISVYYTPKPQPLKGNDSTLYIAPEDEFGMLALTTSILYARDGQTNLATFWANLWRDHLTIRGVVGQPSQAPATGQ
jgi:hypothetical protein